MLFDIVDMKLIVGLGNYPREFDFTKHNVGFMIVDALQRVENFDDWFDSKKLLCNICRGSIDKDECIIIKPNTYMNFSGESVAKVMQFYKISGKDIIVIQDELDIGFGDIRTTNSHNSAGHNGIKSINYHVRENYNRIRVGIGKPMNKEYNISDYVLSKFTHEEMDKLEYIIKNAILTLRTLIRK